MTRPGPGPTARAVGCGLSSLRDLKQTPMALSVSGAMTGYRDLRHGERGGVGAPVVVTSSRSHFGGLQTVGVGPDVAIALGHRKSPEW